MQRQKRLYPSGLEMVAMLLCLLYGLGLVGIGFLTSWDYYPVVIALLLCLLLLVFLTTLLGPRRIAEVVQWILTVCLGLLSLYCLAATESCRRGPLPDYRDLWPIGLFVGLACFGLAVVHTFIARHLRSREEE
jgi:hypothetical protein